MAVASGIYSRPPLEADRERAQTFASSSLVLSFADEETEAPQRSVTSPKAPAHPDRVWNAGTLVQGLHACGTRGGSASGARTHRESRTFNGQSPRCCASDGHPGDASAAAPGPAVTGAGSFFPLREDRIHGSFEAKPCPSPLCRRPRAGSLPVLPGPVRPEGEDGGDTFHLWDGGPGVFGLQPATRTLLVH